MRPGERGFITAGRGLMINTGPVLVAGRPRVLFDGPYGDTTACTGYDVTPGGQRFLMVERAERTGEPVTHINVVLNWFEELKRRVPTR